MIRHQTKPSTGPTAPAMNLFIDNGVEPCASRLPAIAKTSIPLKHTAENIGKLKPFIERINRDLKLTLKGGSVK